MANVYKSVLKNGALPTGNAVPADVLSGKTFSNADGTDKVGTMTNNGAVAPTALDPGGSYTIPQGYHNGNGAVNAKSNTATYTANTRGTALDMGAANLNRYVNTSGVPNSNSGTYTFPVNDTGGTKDLGDTNTYRYVNAQNVYNKGKDDGTASFGFKLSIAVNPSQLIIYDSNFKLKSYAGYVTAADFSNIATVQRAYDGNQVLTITPVNNCKIKYLENSDSGGTPSTMNLIAGTAYSFHFFNDNAFGAYLY